MRDTKRFPSSPWHRRRRLKRQKARRLIPVDEAWCSFGFCLLGTIRDQVTLSLAICGLLWLVAECHGREKEAGRRGTAMVMATSMRSSMHKLLASRKKKETKTKRLHRSQDTMGSNSHCQIRSSQHRSSHRLQPSRHTPRKTCVWSSRISCRRFRVVPRCQRL